jgi:hypothetical protein
MKTPEGETTCPGCGTIWVGDNPSVGFESLAEGSFPSHNAAACPVHAAAPALLEALEAADDLWEMLPFDSGEDIAKVAERVQKIQSAAIEATK